MPLPWIRLDTYTFENPKFLYLKEDGHYKQIVIHLEGMTYSARHNLGGFIPKSALKVIGGTARDARILVEFGLWTPCQGGWQINNWEEYQLSGDEVERRRKRAQDAARARWHPNS